MSRSPRAPGGPAPPRPVAPAATLLLAPARLAALAATALLDTPPELTFDRVMRLVTRVLGVPTALFTLITADREFFKSAVGLAAPWATRWEAPLSHSFC